MRGWSDRREEQLERLAERPPGQASLAPSSNGMSDKGGGFVYIGVGWAYTLEQRQHCAGDTELQHDHTCTQIHPRPGGGVSDGEQQAARGLDSHLAQ
jgi:hypothetical protein